MGLMAWIMEVFAFSSLPILKGSIPIVSLLVRRAKDSDSKLSSLIARLLACRAMIYQTLPITFIPNASPCRRYPLCRGDASGKSPAPALAPSRVYDLGGGVSGLEMGVFLAIDWMRSFSEGLSVSFGLVGKVAPPNLILFKSASVKGLLACNRAS